jgi:hypothetical protein
MKKQIFLLLSLFLLVSAGCKTAPEETEPVSWEQQQSFLKKVRDPRLYGLGIYQTPAGRQIRGDGRLHPSQAAALPMLLEEPWRPVVNMNGKFGLQWPVLLDCSAPVSVFEFDTALSAGARPVAEGRAQMLNLTGDEIPYCLSLIPSIRLGQLYIENQLVMVRMANGPLGRSERGIDDPQLTGVLGWDLLKNFEQVQFLYSIGQIVLKSTEPYVANPGLLAARLPLVEHRGACMVRGTMNGEDEMIIIDPAGDFEVAAGPGTDVTELHLAAGVGVSGPTVAVSPGGVRIGARFLKNYRVTLCPKAGVVYFEARVETEQ